MRRLFLVLVFLTGSAAYAQIQTILTVGDIPITSYDVEEMRSFLESMGGKKPAASEALESLLYQTTLIAIGDSNPDFGMGEPEFRRTLSMITNTTAQEGAEQRKRIYEKFPDLFRLAVRSDKTKRAIMYGDPKIRALINVPTTVQEKRTFYNKNKKDMKDSVFPKVNLLVFAVEASDKYTLGQLTEIEESMTALARDLNTSSDFNTLRKKYGKLRLTKYSGESGLFTPDILVLQKGLPEEVVGVSLQKNIPLGATNITIAKNRGIFIPAPIPLRSTKIPTYITFKLLDIVQPRELTFDEASPRIDEVLRTSRGETAVRDLVAQRIRDGQVTLTLSDAGAFRPVIDKFVSGVSEKKTAPAKEKKK